MEIHSQFFREHNNTDAIKNRLLVVPTQRLASELENDWGALHLARGDTVWPMLNVMPWQRYIEYIANEVSEFPLISPSQRQYLWQRVTNELMDERDDILSSRSIIATWLQDAEGLIVDYAMGTIDDDSRDYAGTQQFEFVVAALERATKLCRDWQRSRIIDLVSEEASLKALADCWQRDRALWVGFEQLTPLQQKIGDSIEPLREDLTLKMANYRSFPLADNELDSVLLSAQKEASNKKRVAIIVADLARSYQSIVERIGLMELTEASFQISASAPLAEHPVIQSLIRHVNVVLGLDSDIETIVHWYSDELVEAGEFYRRMRCFGDLKRAIVSRFDLPFLHGWLVKQSQANQDLFAWMSEKERIYHWREDLKTSARIIDWNEKLETVLTDSGWGRDVVFNSEAIQAIDAFHNILRSLIDIDLIEEQLVGKEYLSLLMQSLTAQSFQRKQDRAPISISGWREIAGLSYEVIFVVDQHSTNWPPSQSPSPLLPLRLQKKYGMNGQDDPNTTVKELIKRLGDSGAEVRFSYGLKEAEEERQSARQLEVIAGVPENAAIVEPESNAIEYQQRVDAALPLQKIDRVRGVAALNGMFSCPFIALADQRLKLRRRYPESAGISPLMIGLLVDKTMQYLVPKLKEVHATTLDMQEAHAHISKQLKSILADYLGYISEGQINRAAERILHRAIEWITTYDALYLTEYQSEVAIEGEIEGLPIKGRIDRMDKAIFPIDKDDQTLYEVNELSGIPRIIDYKSGHNNFTQKMWRADALRDLQLPIYTIISNFIGEIGIAHISLSEVGWYAERLTTQTISEYQTILDGLAKGFVDGNYPLQPSKQNQCNECSYELLCRRDLWFSDNEEGME